MGHCWEQQEIFVILFQKGKDLITSVNHEKAVLEGVKKNPEI